NCGGPKKWKPGKSRPSVWTAQLASLGPELARLVNPRRCDDAGDQFGGGDIKARVKGAAAGIRDTDIRPATFSCVADFAFRTSRFGLRISPRSPRAENLAFMPLLDWNIKARFQIPINRGQRNGHVTRDALAR